MDEKYNEFLGGNPNAPQITTPISFPEHLSNSPFRKFGVNEDKRFAINRFTNNGAYIRGDTICYELNGVQVFAPINATIMVNLNMNTLFILDESKTNNVSNTISSTNNIDPEEKQYIILYILLTTEPGEEDNGIPVDAYRWESIKGRTNAYDSIKINAPVIDIDKSLVLVDNVPLKDALSVREFANYLKNSNIIIDESFDIEDYSSEYI